jgi:hypothetical protein
MQNGEQKAGGRDAKRELIRTAAATGAVMVLILALGFIGNQLYVIEEQLAESPLKADWEAVMLPADLVAKGRAVYVPAYSHIYARGAAVIPLAVTLSVRNTDPEHPIRIDRVRYFDGDGKLLRDLVDQPIVLGPMQTDSHLVEADKIRGGSGANFVVEWSAQETINRPIIEAVMIGDGGLSFTSRGESIERH